MRKIHIAALALTITIVAFAFTNATPANAVIYYPWCARYTGDDGGASNCYFRTRSQCYAAISGAGGICEPNGFYDAYGSGQEPGHATAPGKRKRARHHY